jgi:hypothetical protein
MQLMYKSFAEKITGGTFTCKLYNCLTAIKFMKTLVKLVETTSCYVVGH